MKEIVLRFEFQPKNDGKEKPRQVPTSSHDIHFSAHFSRRSPH
jgi:hypothetical protein